MANVTLDPVVEYIHKLARKWTNQGANDADLLNRFVTSRDENAFVGLVLLTKISRAWQSRN